MKYILFLLLTGSFAYGGFPPTATKASGDSTYTTTFNFDFPNFAVTRSGVTTTFGINGLAGGGTGANLSPVAGGLVYSTGSILGITAAGASGDLAFSTGTGAPTFHSPSFLGGTFLQVTNNLSDLNNIVTARTNLGLGTSATVSTSSFDLSGAASAAVNLSLQKASNLSDVSSADASRSSLGVGKLQSPQFAGLGILGNVGVGTLAPGASIDVKGSIRLSGVTSGSVTFVAPAVASNASYTWPSADGTVGQQLSTNGSGIMNWVNPTAGTYTSPTITKIITPGSGVYTTPANVLYLRVRMVGGGGGGGGSADAGNDNGQTGSAGTETTFGATLLRAYGGAGGAIQGVGASGGYASFDPTLATVAVAASGSRGSSGFYTLSTNSYGSGGNGGVSFFGCAGAGGANGNNNAAPGSCYGGGGGGGSGVANAAGTASASGGGAGGFIEAYLNSPAASYVYTIGNAGSAGNRGTNGQPGASGAAGYLEVTPFYQ